MTQKKDADPLLEYCKSHDLALVDSGDESEREAEIERIYGIVRERGYEPTGLRQIAQQVGTQPE